MKKICILGSGSWGTALGLQLCKNKYSVSMWTLKEEQAEEINIKRTNNKYLPGIKLSDNMECTTDLEKAIKDSIFIILAVPSQVIRNVCKQIKPFVNSNQILVNVAKGLEQDSGLRLSQICKEELPDNKFVVLSGPSHAEEVALEQPTTLTVASEYIEDAEFIQNAFCNESLRVYTNDDVVGVELGGALKNIIAFGAGICDGLEYGDNTKAALMTRGLTEITRLGVAMGAKESTFAGLTGIGDLIVTCTSMHSRNRRAGILIGQGKTLDETLKEIEMVVEGITATKAAYDVSKKLNIEMPITTAIYNVLYNNDNAHEAILDLMQREQKHESDYM